MPVKTNRFYNDPALGAAFSNLASAFAPPSAQDAAFYATAKTKNEEAARLAELFATAKNPNVDRTTFDRLAVGGGLYNPSNSYYSVDQSNATTRRGQDVNASTTLATNRLTNDTTRRGQDITAATARDVATTQERAGTFRTLMTPMGKDTYRPALPQSIADMYGLPTAPQYGVMEVGQGQKLVTPDGREIQGNEKPRTEAEVKGAVLAGLPARDQRDVAMQGVPVEKIVGGDGKPAYATRTDAVGQPAYVDGVKPTEISQLMTERDALPAGDTRRQAYDARIAALGRGQQEGTYDKTNNEALANLNESISKSAMGAVADKGTLQMLSEAVNNPNASQGALGGANLALRKYLNAFGVDAGDTSPQEMINALGNQLALRLRDPSNGAGMPGSLSDSDREFLRSMTVSLGNSPEANKKLVDYYIKIQNKNIDLDNMRRDYVAQHGRIDEGFRNQVSDFLQKTGIYSTSASPAAPAPGGPAPVGVAPASGGPAPVVPAGAPAPAPAAAAPAPAAARAPQVGAVEDGHRFKGGNPSDPANWEAVR